MTAFDAMNRAAIADVSVAEMRAWIAHAIRKAGHPRPADLIYFASGGVASDRDVLPGEERLSISRWADRLAARGL